MWRQASGNDLIARTGDRCRGLHGMASAVVLPPGRGGLPTASFGQVVADPAPVEDVAWVGRVVTQLAAEICDDDAHSVRIGVVVCANRSGPSRIGPVAQSGGPATPEA